MKSKSKKIKDIGVGLILLIVIFILWEVLSRVINKSLFLPSPKDTFAIIQNLFTTGALWRHLGYTFGRVTIAILITAVISIPLGMGIAWFKPIRTIFEPIVKALRFIPVTAFSPILILTVGIGESMKITFLVIATLFSFLPTVIQTCMDADKDLEETGYTMGFSYTRNIFHVLIPYVVPSLLKSFITLYGVGWTFVIIAEATNTQNGLGHLMYIGSARGRTDMVFAALLVVIVVSFLFDKIANFIINKKYSWRYHNNGK